MMGLNIKKNWIDKSASGHVETHILPSKTIPDYQVVGVFSQVRKMHSTQLAVQNEK